LNREIATEIIGMTGVTIDSAENGKIAVEKVMEAPEKWSDLIFMDIQMPIMNGYEATAAIRALAGSRGKVPIIAMTANAFAEDVQLAKNTGMNEHIAKPLDLNKLNDVLKQWL
ncbi:MAG: response regulator, partial [Faecalibacterium prausnitzii]|nr:response regulator [Faecalibacterium prausnitzii]